MMKSAIEEHLRCSAYPRIGTVLAKDGNVLSIGYRGELNNMRAERIASRTA